MSGKAHEPSGHNPWLETGFLVSEIIVIVLYGFCTEYGDGVHPAAASTKTVGSNAAVSAAVA